MDHDHLSGLVRGLLCAQCNRGLGFFRDSVWLLERAIGYLTMHDELKRGSPVYPGGTKAEQARQRNRAASRVVDEAVTEGLIDILGRDDGRHLEVLMSDHGWANVRELNARCLKDAIRGLAPP